MYITSYWVRFRTYLLGHPLRLGDRSLFHKITLGAILAWIGVGADGLSSSCYGPEETFKALGAYTSLSPVIALMCVATITVICISYRQIIELFPGGGGGYLVARSIIVAGCRGCFRLCITDRLRFDHFDIDCQWH
ncbi:MAG: hypothetical protein KatS3mg104_0023 [Phycisphaerae bacterium]|nr:MAG: hypothetical protein KatS3mg104_0023 [Phycisphaerae bacterium]